MNELLAIASQAWSEGTRIKMANFSVNGKTIPIYYAPDYIAVGDFLFTSFEEFEKHRNVLAPISDKVIACWMGKNDLEMADFDTAYAIHTLLAILTLQAFSETIKDAVVVDAGSGDGILATLVSRLGARRVIAIERQPDWFLILKKGLTTNSATNIEAVSDTFANCRNIEGVNKAEVVIANLQRAGNYEGRNWHQFLSEEIEPKWYFAFGFCYCDNSPTINLGRIGKTTFSHMMELSNAFVFHNP